MSILSKLIVTALCLTLCLDATALLWENCTIDADCDEKLKCNVANLRCGGDGTSGAHCQGTQDLNCGSNLECDYITKTCRAKGTGSLGQGCGGANDANCNSGLTCSNHKCRAKGNGAIGEPCSVGDDASCGPGGVCDHETETCRNKGSGTSGQICYYNSDGYGDIQGNFDTDCISGFSCDVNTSKCRTATVGGGPGAPCGAITDTCSGTCDELTLKCRATGDGTVGANCTVYLGGVSDTPCSSTGGVCDYTTHTCRNVGSGTNGAKCEQIGDDSRCTGVCDYFTHTCRTAGNGAENAYCLHDPNFSTTSDADCSSPTKKLICDKSDAGYKCRSIGHGADGQACSLIQWDGDEYCANCDNGVCGGDGDDDGSAASRIYLPALAIFSLLALFI